MYNQWNSANVDQLALRKGDGCVLYSFCAAWGWKTGGFSASPRGPVTGWPGPLA